MGYREDRIARSTASLHRAQQMTSVYAVMLCVLILLFLQFLMLAAALDGYLAGKQLFVLPTAVASGICCALRASSLGTCSHRDRRVQRHDRRKEPSPLGQGGTSGWLSTTTWS